MTLPPSEEKPQTTQPPQTQSPNSLPKSDGFLNRRNLISLLAAVLFASFFMPWTYLIPGNNLSGFDLLKGGSRILVVKLLWLMPTCALLALMLNTIGLATSVIRRVAGIMPILLLIYVISHEGQLLQSMLWGYWTALISGILITATLGPPRDRQKKKTLTSVQLEKGNVLRHWYVPIPGFETSTAEFYADIEAELKARKVPGLEISRVEYAEGGLLSDQREYLRMIRERLVFDICSAPFGTAHFFSCRCAEIQAIVRLWQVALVLIGMLVFIAVFLKLFGLLLGAVIAVAAFGVAIFLARNSVALGLRDVDAALLKSPVVGSIYERFFRKETYYREDTRLMYCDTVNEIVKAKVEEVTGAKGIKLVRFNEFDPILGELYKPRLVTLSDEPAAKAA